MIMIMKAEKLRNTESNTFVYYRRKPFDLGLFDDFVARKWPRDVVRAKGICYFDDERDMCYVFEQAGKQKTVKQAGQWLATMPKSELAQVLLNNPQLQKEWDQELGDRMIKNRIHRSAYQGTERCYHCRARQVFGVESYSPGFLAKS